MGRGVRVEWGGEVVESHCMGLGSSRKRNPFSPMSSELGMHVAVSHTELVLLKVVLPVYFLGDVFCACVCAVFKEKKRRKKERRKMTMFNNDVNS